MEQIRLQVWDYLVCALLLAATFAIGIYYAVVLRKRNSVAEYLFASGSMSFIPLTLSLQASFESTLMMMGMPSEVYSYGMQYMIFEIGYENGRVIEQMCLLTFMRKLGLVSPFEYLELRFKSRPLRLLATVMGCLDNLLYMSVVLYGQAVAFQAVTGISMIASTVVTASAAVIYTSIGGLRAVVWTDVLQLFLIITGMLLFLTKGTMDIGGVYEVWRRSALSGRLDLNTDPDITYRNNIYALLFGAPFLGIGFLFKPAVLQRVTAARTVATAQRAVLIALFCFVISYMLAMMQGLVSYSYFDVKGCDPVVSKMIDGPNQVVPFMTMEIFSQQPGLSGLFLAGLFSATLSTMSSCLSALANISLEDFIKPHFPSLSEFRSVCCAKISVVIFGVVSTGLAVFISVVGNNSINQIYIVLVSVTRSPGTAMMYLGLLFPFVNAKSAFSAFLVGVSFLSWLVIGAKTSSNIRKQQPLPPASIDHCPNVNASVLSSMISPQTPLDETTRSGLDTFYNVSYALYGAFGFLAVLLVGIILGIATGGYKDEVDIKYILPIGRKLHKLVPSPLKHFLTANYKDENPSPKVMDLGMNTTEKESDDACTENETFL